nr:MFS transporter [Deinococcota bacterium]
QADLGASVVDVQWIINAFTLFLAALILLGGSLGDRLGRKRVFMAGAVVFTGASVWCGLAPDAGQLIMARALQGVGGALLTPGSLAIISASFPEHERGAAIGLWSGFSAMTAALGPVIGGWLIETLSWRWIFFINVPLAVVVLLIAFWRVPESRDEETRGGLDWWGAALATLGLAGLTYGLLESSARGLTDPLVLAALAGGAVMLALFLLVEAQGRFPMVPLTLFRSSTFSGANLLTLLLYAALGGALFFLPFNLIQVQGYSATAAGAALLPMILLMSFLSRWSGGLVARFGAKLPLTVGPVIAAAGFALFTLPGIGGSYWTTFFPAVSVLGLGMAVSVAPLTTAVMGAVASHYAGTASGVNNAVARVASLLAVALLGIIMLFAFNTALTGHLAPLDLDPQVRQALDAERVNLANARLPDGLDANLSATLERAIDASFVAGFRVVMVIAAGLALASALVAWLMIEGRAAKDPEHKTRA